MNELFKDKNRPFYSFGSKYELEPIPEKAWIGHILSSFEKGSHTLDRQIANRINETSLGHPYYTQLLCSEIWETCRDKRSITEEDVATALQKALDKEDHAFQEIWDSLSLSQKKIIHTLAHEPEVALFSAAAAQKHGLGAQSSNHRTVSQLLKKGLLSKKNGRYFLTDPFIQKWLLSRH